MTDAFPDPARAQGVPSPGQSRGPSATQGSPPSPTSGAVPSPRPGAVPVPPRPHAPVPGPAATGTDRTLADLEVALRPLDTLTDTPVDVHPAVFESVHESLQRTLAESDS